MTELKRYSMDIDYYWDDCIEDSYKVHYVRERDSDNGEWVLYEDVVDLKSKNQELTKRIAELEIENMILKKKEQP